MSNKREFPNIETSKDMGVPGVVKEPALPVFIPMRIVRWFAYSFCFAAILAPGFWQINARGVIGVSFILGHFASQLNALINKKA